MLGGRIGRSHHDVADRAAGELERFGQKAKIKIVGARHRRSEASLPQLPTVLLFGFRKVDKRVQPSCKRLVEVGPQVGGQDGDAIEELHSLKQIGDFDVRITIVRIADLRALAKKRIGLVKQDHTVDALRLGEDAIEVLLGFPNVFVDDGGQVHGVQVKAKLAGQHLGRHRFARARRPGEQGRQSAPARRRTAHLPDIEHLLAIAGPGQQLFELGHCVGRQHQVGKADRRLDPPRQSLETGRILGASARLQLVFVQRDLTSVGLHPRRPSRPMDLLRRQPKLRHGARQVEPGRRVPVEVPTPEFRSVGCIRNRGLADEGDVARPRRIPCPSPDQNDRGRHLGKGADRGKAPGDQDFDRTGDDAGSDEARLPGGQGRHHRQVILGPQPLEVEGQRGPAYLREGA